MFIYLEREKILEVLSSILVHPCTRQNVRLCIRSIVYPYQTQQKCILISMFNLRALAFLVAERRCFHPHPPFPGSFPVSWGILNNNDQTLVWYHCQTPWSENPGSSKQISPVHRRELVATASVPLQNFSDSENRVIVVSVRDTVDSSAISKQLLEDPEVVFVFCTRVSV